MKRHRAWCFTDHDTSDERIEWYQNNFGKTAADTKVRSVIYAIVAYEVGDLGKEHLQGYIRFEHAVSMGGVKKRLNSKSVHLEPRKGTEYEAASYCWKEGSRTVAEIGERPTENNTKDTSIWDVILRMLEDGATNADIMRKYPAAYARYSTGIERMRMDILSENLNTWRDLQVHYIWGATGVGKTRGVLDSVPSPQDVFRVTDYKHPFDNYRGQSVLMLEEFRSSLPLEQMLVYLDGYVCELPCRYANKVSGWTHVFIVTNIPPDQQYNAVQRNHPETFAAWERRIATVREWTAQRTIVTKGNTGTLVTDEGQFHVPQQPGDHTRASIELTTAAGSLEQWTDDGSSSHRETHAVQPATTELRK